MEPRGAVYNEEGAFRELEASLRFIEMWLQPHDREDVRQEVRCRFLKALRAGRRPRCIGAWKNPEQDCECLGEFILYYEYAMSQEELGQEACLAHVHWIYKGKCDAL